MPEECQGNCLVSSAVSSWGVLPFVLGCPERRDTSPALGFQSSLWAIREVHSKYSKMLQSILSGCIKCSPLGERSVTDALQVTLLSGFVDSRCCLMWLPAALSLNPCLGLTYSARLCSGALLCTGKWPGPQKAVPWAGSLWGVGGGQELPCPCLNRPWQIAQYPAWESH